MKGENIKMTKIFIAFTEETFPIFIETVYNKIETGNSKTEQEKEELIQLFTFYKDMSLIYEENKSVLFQYHKPETLSGEKLFAILTESADKIVDEYPEDILLVYKDKWRLSDCIEKGNYYDNPFELASIQIIDAVIDYNKCISVQDFSQNSSPSM